MTEHRTGTREDNFTAGERWWRRHDEYEAERAWPSG